MFRANYWSRLLNYILFGISILLINDRLGILLFCIFGFLLSFVDKKYDATISFVISFLIYVFYFIYPFLIILIKISLIISYYFIIKNTITDDERRYIIDKGAYFRSGIKGFIYYIKNYYYVDIKLDNINLIDSLNTTRKKDNFLREEALLKTNYEMNDIYLLNKLRFFKYYPVKTRMYIIKWTAIDVLSVVMSILVLWIIVWEVYL